MEYNKLSRHIIKGLISLLTIVILMGSSVSWAENSRSIMSLLTDDAEQEAFLSPDQAFQLTLTPDADQNIRAQYSIASGHYLYQSRLKFETVDAHIINIKLPDGELKQDPNFGEQMVYHHSFEGLVLLQPNANEISLPETITLKATYQGCSDQGLCYAPIKKTLQVKLNQNTHLRTTIDDLTAPVSSENVEPKSFNNDTANVLKTGNLWLIVVAFFVAGLLLSLTPCVLPMIPILSSIIVGSQAKQTHQTKMHSFLLSLAYVMGMALSYTLAGIAAGLSGSLISQSLQNAWVLGATALLFAVLSLSMFGVYEVKLPERLEAKMRNTSNQLKGGHFFGVFLMGALSALIISPCVAAPLAGALIYIGQTHNVLLGGVGLFALAIGMGMPLLLIGASAGKLLPKAGQWMTAVRNMFGVMMLGMAIWIITPLIPKGVELALWAILSIVIAVYLHALDGLPASYTGIHKLWKGIGVILLIYGIALMLGALSGGQSLINPLGHLTPTHQVGQPQAKPVGLVFQRVQSVSQLEQALEAAKGKPIMLDFYADWCVACKEMEHETFTNPQVQALLKDTQLLQVDVTENNVDDQALLKRFGLYGPPGIIFFDKAGNELSTIETVGFQNPTQFTQTLTRRDACLLSPISKKISQC